MPNNVPRPEYPRPQMKRPDWLCLNGTWEFQCDPGDSGLEQGFLEKPLKERILVPFCPESKLSGIGRTDFMEAVWYRRKFRVPARWKGRRVLLHFQAVDYEATVWVNGREIVRHKGGFTPFSCELTGLCPAGSDATLVLRARDPRKGSQPRGKQSTRLENFNCLYTRTTGIWQTVWLEAVPESYLERPRLTPDLASGRILLTQRIRDGRAGQKLRARLLDGYHTVSEAETEAVLDADFSPLLTLNIPKEQRRPWCPEDPYLYCLEISLLGPDGSLVDRVESYAALRGVRVEGNAVLLNGKRVFQRLVLDQGFYPDGLLTAPSDAALKNDIVLAQRAGFNGARLHQKVFEERFLYHADRLGYLCWGEFPDWGCKLEWPDAGPQKPDATYITQWLEALDRDYSHPSIVGWCPMNETSERLADRLDPLDDVMRGMWLAAKAMDATRPVLDSSGYAHRVAETDVYDCHQYEQDPAKFKAMLKGLARGKPFINGGTPDPDRPRDASPAESLPYAGQPYFVSEFGGIWWAPGPRKERNSWGYGERPKSLAEVYARFKGLCDVLLDDPAMFGYCYTQLTDVFQEQNGIYDFKRRPKFDIRRIRAIQTRKAAFERANPGKA